MMKEATSLTLEFASKVKQIEKAEVILSKYRMKHIGNI
tara:strand:+ start:242 stop:355 length:114 start_codon:yes stop_codon:yes gene_type:complete